MIQLEYYPHLIYLAIAKNVLAFFTKPTLL